VAAQYRSEANAALKNFRKIFFGQGLFNPEPPLNSRESVGTQKHTFSQGISIMAKTISLAEAKARKAAKLAAAPSPQTVERNRTAIENLRLLSRNLDQLHAGMSATSDPAKRDDLRQQRDWLMANLDKM
jgi:hypothetical protein